MRIGITLAPDRTKTAAALLDHPVIVGNIIDVRTVLSHESNSIVVNIVIVAGIRGIHSEGPVIGRIIRRTPPVILIISSYQTPRAAIATTVCAVIAFETAVTNIIRTRICLAAGAIQITSSAKQVPLMRM